MASTIHAVRNWGAILITVVSGCALIASLLYDFSPDSAVGGAAGIAQFLFEYIPGALAIFVGVIVFAFGTKRSGIARLASVAGTNRLGQAAVFVWGLLAAATQVSFLGLLSGDALTLARAEDVQQLCGIGAILIGIFAAILVFRAHVLRGFARYALFLCVILFAVTFVLVLFAGNDLSPLSDLPRVAGLVVLGIAYWRAGVPAATDRSATTSRPSAVTNAPKNLAE